MKEWFEKHENEYLKFERIPTERRLSDRPDLCAFLLLHKLVPGTYDIVRAGEHDKIWLDTNIEQLEVVATEEDIITLIRCGVMFDDEVDSLAMFV